VIEKQLSGLKKAPAKDQEGKPDKAGRGGTRPRGVYLHKGGRYARGGVSVRKGVAQKEKGPSVETIWVYLYTKLETEARKEVEGKRTIVAKPIRGNLIDSTGDGGFQGK